MYNKTYDESISSYDELAPVILDLSVYRKAALATDWEAAKKER